MKIKVLVTLKPLITKNGQISHTKLWSNIAYLCATFVFMYHEIKATSPSIELFIAYVALIGGNTLASKYLDAKYSESSPETKQDERKE